MADFSTLIASIEATIKQNGVQAITGQVLQDELLLMVSAINQLKQDTLEGYAFYGEALPNGATRVVTQNTFFLAGAGSYTINGNAVMITDSGISVIVYDCVNDEISTYQLFAYDANPTSGSANAVTSGGVKSALDTKADKNGASPDLFAGFAGNLVDTRSAGTRQGPFAFRQSGGDGVNYMRKILGRTEAFNQLVGPSDTQVTIPSGHLYYAIINGTASVGTSDGTPIAVTGGVDIVVDLTLEGLGLTTADQFRALHPLGYYSPNAGVLKNNAATGLETTGFNKWDEELEIGSINPTTGENVPSPSTSRSVNYIRVSPNTGYYLRSNQYSSFNVLFYDANKNFISYIIVQRNTSFVTPGNVGYIRFSYASNVSLIGDICINLSDPDRNGIYEPYWKREIALGLNSIACHDENNNAVVVNGLDGVGTAQDELIVENGWGTKIIKRFAEVDLGDLEWVVDDAEWNAFKAPKPQGIKLCGATETLNCISTKFSGGLMNSYCAAAGVDTVLTYSGTPSYIYAQSSEAYTDAAAFKAAVTGVKLRYELATPKVLTLDNPIPALIDVDNLGTEKRLPEDTAANPQAPFECDSNYSISTANLVRKLSE